MIATFADVSSAHTL